MLERSWAAESLRRFALVELERLMRRGHSHRYLYMNEEINGIQGEINVSPLHGYPYGYPCGCDVIPCCIILGQFDQGKLYVFKI